MRLTSVASVKRGGGSVKCWVESMRSFVEPLVFRHNRQTAAVLILLVVAAFLIKFQEAVEADDLAGGAKIELARARFGQNIDRGALEFGRFHLAGDGAGPDQLVELRLVRLQRAGDPARQARQVGRADRFMRFLRILGLDRIFARRLRHVGVAEFAAR